jgi:hypothetical protein
MRALVRHVLAWLVPLWALLFASPLHAGRLAGTVLIRQGAVAALSGSGEEEQVRRSVRSLRVDQGDRLQTSPKVEASFLGHDETQVPLEGSSTYLVTRDGLWKMEGKTRLRVLEFLRSPGKTWRRGAPDGSKPLANLRSTGAPRGRSSRDFHAVLLDGDMVMAANSQVDLGLDDRALLALVEEGRVALHGSSRLFLQRRALVLSYGALHVRAGGPARMVLTPALGLAATRGGVFQVGVDPDGEHRILCLGGKLLVAPAPGLSGPRWRLLPGDLLEGSPAQWKAPRKVLTGDRLVGALEGVLAALQGSDPLQVTQRASEATRIPKVGGPQAPRHQASEEPDEFGASQIPPRFAQDPGRDDEAARAVARTLDGGKGEFGSEWQVRDRRSRKWRPSTRSTSAVPAAPAVLPPGLVASSVHGMTSPQHPLWSSAGGVLTPTVPRR